MTNLLILPAPRHDLDGEGIIRQQITYTCANGHETPRLFAADARVPEVWDCKWCGKHAGLNPAAPPAEPVVEVFKTHFDYVRERRTDAEGEALIAEAIAGMRARGL